METQEVKLSFSSRLKETWKEDEDRSELSENAWGEKIQTCLHLEISKPYEGAKEQGGRQSKEQRENENGEKLHEKDRKSSLVVLAKTPWKTYWKNRIYWLGTYINYPTLKSYQLQKVGTQALNFSLLLHQSAWLSRHWGDKNLLSLGAPALPLSAVLVKACSHLACGMACSILCHRQF